jgi:hypothetical protein
MSMIARLVHRNTLTRALPLWLTIAAALPISAQSGLRLSPWNYDLFLEKDEDFFHHLVGVGLAFDHDLDRRLSYAIEFRLSEETLSKEGSLHGTQLQGNAELHYYGESRAYCLTYRAAYHFSNNERTSGYIGGYVALRWLRSDLRLGSVEDRSTHASLPVSDHESSVEHTGVVVPIGVRLGLRGGLEHFYAEMYAAFGFQIGNELPFLGKDFKSGSPVLSRSMVMLGLDIGFGWAGKQR